MGSLPRRGRRTQPGVLTPGKTSPRDRPERAPGSAGSVPRRSLIERHPMFLQQGPKLFFECHLAMMSLLAGNRRDNRLPHLAPFQGVRLIGSFPGLKPRVESSCPFGVENPLQKSLSLCLWAAAGRSRVFAPYHHSPVRGLQCPLQQHKRCTGNESRY